MIFNKTRNKRTCHSGNGKVYTHTMVKISLSITYSHADNERGVHNC